MVPQEILCFKVRQRTSLRLGATIGKSFCFKVIVIGTSFGAVLDGVVCFIVIADVSVGIMVRA